MFKTSGFLSLFLSLWLSAAACQARVWVEAYAGEPFGVGRITVNGLWERDRSFLPSHAFQLKTDGGRLLYPSYSIDHYSVSGDPRQRTAVTAFFLFRGDEPLLVELQTPQKLTKVTTPQTSPDKRRRLLALWWNQWRRFYQRQRRGGDYEPVLETYMASMLAGRLRLPLPAEIRAPVSSNSEPLRHPMELLLRERNERHELFQQVALGAAPSEQPAIWPAPPAVYPEPPLRVDPLGPQPAWTADDSMAWRVPQECYYVRFRNFNDYLWLRKRLQYYDGDLTRMVMLRGHSQDPSLQIQEQLALKESWLSEAVGKKLIDKLAMVGFDFYRDGAASGVLFEVSDSKAFQGALKTQRTAAVLLGRKRGVQREQVELEGRKVSFLHSPDGRLRSYYIVDGDLHLVTNSRRLAERFLQTKRGLGTLGGTLEFQDRRRRLQSSEESIFICFSSAFFRQLAAPQAWLERRRRMRAGVELELAQAALQAARNEHRVVKEFAHLQESDLLPPNFARRNETARPKLNEAGSQTAELIDSQRGALGAFPPVADAEPFLVSPREYWTYRTQTAYLAERGDFPRTLAFSIRRRDFGERHEQIEIDAALPREELRLLDRRNLWGQVQDRLQGRSVERVDVRIGPHESSARALVRGEVVDIHLVAQLSLPRLVESIIQRQQQGRQAFSLSSLQPALLGWDFSLQIKPRLVRNVLRYLHLRRQRRYAPAPAAEFPPLSVSVADLSNSPLAQRLHAWSDQRRSQLSNANLRYLHFISQQLGAPRKDALKIAERFSHSDLLAPPRGNWKLVSLNDQFRYWRAEPSKTAPTTAPLLQWFRGLQLDVAPQGDCFLARLNVNVRKEPTDKKK